jgi:hypothetical protein
MRVIETKVWEIDEHPNKDLCYQWIRNSWHDLNQHSVEEMELSIQKLIDRIGGTCDYAISQSPDRGEFISFEGYDSVLLDDLVEDDFPLTGSYFDAELISSLKRGTPSSALASVHKETEAVYSDDGLFDLCLINEYEFNNKGEWKQ